MFRWSEFQAKLTTKPCKNDLLRRSRLIYLLSAFVLLTHPVSSCACLPRILPLLAKYHTLRRMRQRICGICSSLTHKKEDKIYYIRVSSQFWGCFMVFFSLCGRLSVVRIHFRRRERYTLIEFILRWICAAFIIPPRWLTFIRRTHTPVAAIDFCMNGSK